jgi:Gas vesicle synthesis protein GvpL/GvpF
MDETIVHAYGIVAENEALAEFPPGIAETRVWVFEADGFGAIVSLLPAEGFGVSDWEQNAANVSWLGRVARQHHEVLQYASMNATVVPLRLPSLYQSLESLAATLGAASDRLERDLGRIQGKVEWAVKAYRTAEADRSAVSAGSASGRDYLIARSRDLSARNTVRQQLSEQVREIHNALGEVSAEQVRNQPQDAALSGRSEHMLLNGAYLVSRADEARFLELVGKIADSSLANGILVEVSGPWPAYNFTGDAEATATEALK